MKTKIIPPFDHEVALLDRKPLLKELRKEKLDKRSCCLELKELTNFLFGCRENVNGQVIRMAPKKV